MKTLTAIAVAAALIAPQAVLAQRHTTPGQAERHAAAQAAASDKAERTGTVDMAINEDRGQNLHINAAKAGKINTAKANRGGAS